MQSYAHTVYKYYGVWKCTDLKHKSKWEMSAGELGDESEMILQVWLINSRVHHTQVYFTAAKGPSQNPHLQ